MTTFTCTCNTPPCPEHTSSAMCAANREATMRMMERQHQPKLREVRAGGKFVRFPDGDEWALPTGSAVDGGTIIQP